MKKNKKIIIYIIVIIILLITILLFENIIKENNKLNQTKKAIEQIFFYLPENNYTDLNEISDNCKINLIYNTDFLKSDIMISIDDYDTIVKNNGIKAYSKRNINKAIKLILGKNASINFEKDEYDNYPFLTANECKNSNKNIKQLSYNEEKKYIFSIDKNEPNNIKLYVKWKNEEHNGNYIILKAQALLAIKNDNNKYDIYSDNKLNHLVDSLTEKELKNKINNLYELNSMDYIITLKKENNNYIWIKYEIINNNYSEEATN